MNNFNALIFGNKLKDLRRQFGLTQHDLADRLGIHVNTVCSYENGKKVPPINIVHDLVVLFGVSADYLLNPDTERAISLKGLTSNQQAIIKELADEFSSKERIHQKRLTPHQQKIVTELVAEFFADPMEK